MFDAANGWAENAEGFGGVFAKGAEGSIVRTTDGGFHWKDVTPPALRGQQLTWPVHGVGWLSSDSTWVWATVETPKPNTHVLFHTVDGGQMWRSMTVPFSVGPVDFINSRDGWLYVGKLETHRTTGDVYRTTDGGETWREVGSAEFPGSATTITFRDRATGWIMGWNRAPDGPYLLVTRDGGRTWEQQRMALPPHLNAQDVDMIPFFTFLTARDGILPVLYGTPTGAGVFFYVTRNGGTTWMRTMPVTTLESWTAGSGNLWPDYRSSDFADIDHGWVTDGNRLSATSDGGRHWKTWRPGPPFTYMQELSFISPQIGWASGQPLMDSHLLRTVDGGRTWTLVPHVILR